MFIQLLQSITQALNYDLGLELTTLTDNLVYVGIHKSLLGYKSMLDCNPKVIEVVPYRYCTISRGSKSVTKWSIHINTSSLRSIHRKNREFTKVDCSTQEDATSPSPTFIPLRLFTISVQAACNEYRFPFHSTFIRPHKQTSTWHAQVYSQRSTIV